MKISLSIILVNFNGNEDTIECIKSIEEFVDNNKVDLTVILVDNGSKQPIDDRVIYNLKIPIVYIKNNENLGFAGGNNIGIKYALEINADYIALINNDTTFVDDSLYRLVNKMEKETIHIGGIVNYYFDKPNKIWQTGFINDFKRGDNHLVKSLSNEGDEFVDVDYVPGSSIVINQAVFNKIGTLDQEYFAYYEENDFCIRAKRSGFKVAFLENTKILHKVGKSSNSNIKVYLRTRNKLLFFKRYSSSFAFFFIYISVLLAYLKDLILRRKLKIISIKILFWAFSDFHKKNFGKGKIDKIIKHKLNGL